MANQYQFENVKDWAGQVAANRVMLVNLFGGFAVAITIYFTYQNFKIAQDNLRTSVANLKLTGDRLVADTFSKAVEQLGHADKSVRLGGIFSLARIAKSSRTDYFHVMQVLTGFIRERSRAPGSQSNREENVSGIIQLPS